MKKINCFFAISKIHSKTQYYFTGTIPLKYTHDHEWIKYDSVTNIGKIGITDYA